ncbi:MAG: pilus assembly protein TadG-related protein, partial [Armatimonadota bacterium]
IVMMLSLIGMAALVIDIGRLIVVAQHVQNVADASALAGAAVLPDVQAANTRLQHMVQTNNQETPEFAISVTPGTDVVIHNPGHTIAGYGALGDDDYACEVTCHSTVEYVFAKIFGMQSTTVTRSATALSEPASAGGGGGGGVFFASESAPGQWGIVFNGSHQHVGGNAHSNTRVAINGSHQTITGTLTYRHQFIINGAHQDIGAEEEGEIEPYPVDYDREDYYNHGPYDHVYTRPVFNGSNQTLPSGDWKVNGDLNINGSGFSISDATIMIDGSLYLNLNGDGSHFEANNCVIIADDYIIANRAGIEFNETTLIAGEAIYLNGALKECSFNPACDGLFAMAEGTGGIIYNGARQRTEGVLYAPNGPVTYNGAHQEVYNGGIAARTITVNGAHGTFNPHEQYGFGGGGSSARTVSLIR